MSTAHHKRGPETAKLVTQMMSVMDKRDMTLIEVATELNLLLDRSHHITHPNCVWLWVRKGQSPNSERIIAIQKWLASPKGNGLSAKTKNKTNKN